MVAPAMITCPRRPLWLWQYESDDRQIQTYGCSPNMSKVEPSDGHQVLENLVHVTGAARIVGGQENVLVQ